MGHSVSKVSALISAASLAAACALAGCAAPRNAANQQPDSSTLPGVVVRAAEIERDPYKALGYQLEWTGFPTVLDGQRIARAELLGDLVAVQDSAGILSVLETRSGATRWSAQLASTLTLFLGSVRLASGRGSVVCCSDTDVYIMDAPTGTLRAKQPLARAATTRPVLIGDSIILGTSTGELYAHSLLTGIRLWGYALRGAITSNPIPLASADEGLVAVVSAEGDVLIVDAGSGTSAGRAKVYRGLASDPAHSPGRIFLAGLDQSVYSFSTRGGGQVWRKRTPYPLTHQPVCIDDALYLCVGPEFRRLDAATGNDVWTAPAVTGRVVAMRAGRLLVWNGSDAALLDPATGDVVARATLDAAGDLFTDSFEDGALYVVRRSDGKPCVSKYLPRR